MELRFDKGKNLEERLKFVHYYAEWVKSVPNEVWSKQQAELIDSFILNATNFKMTPEKYLEMVNKEAAKKPRDSTRLTQEDVLDLGLINNKGHLKA